MTVILLVSISLFALVVTSRPILSPNANSAPTSSTLQTSVQAPFRIHPGKDDPTSDAMRFHFERSKQQIEYLSQLGREYVAAAASFHMPPEESLEAPSDETAGAQDTFYVNNELDETRAGDVTDELVASEPVADKRHEVPTNESLSAPLVILALSCATALLMLACIALSLYIIKSLQSQMLASKTAWELLPRFWMRSRSQENTSAAAKKLLSGGDCLLLQTEIGQQRLLDTEGKPAQRRELRPGDRPLYLDTALDIETELDDMDEKFQDALDMTPLPLIRNLPLEDNVSHPSHFDNPPVPPLRTYPLGSQTADRSTPLMRGLSFPPSPVSRPTWSVRAMDSPALGLSSRQGGHDATSQPLIHPRRRAYRSPVPEFDIALAMQLRPGLGIGADSAWMVRFLMAIFGWFVVALTGNVR